MALSAEAPNFVPNIKLNCFTSVQFFEPLSGQAISNSSIKAFTSARFSVSKDRAIRSRISFFLAKYSITRGFVVLYCSSSNEAPKRSRALSISFCAFWFNFSA